MPRFPTDTDRKFVLSGLPTDSRSSNLLCGRHVDAKPAELIIERLRLWLHHAPHQLVQGFLRGSSSHWDMPIPGAAQRPRTHSDVACSRS